MTGGHFAKAQHLERPGNIRWEIFVQPDSNGTLTVVLPATSDCDGQGAMCTGDVRMLAGPSTLTVPGPV